MTRYTLESSGMIHTPGLLAWAINGYAFERDRPTIKRIFTEGYRLSDDTAHRLLSGDIDYEVDGASVTFDT